MRLFLLLSLIPFLLNAQSEEYSQIKVNKEIANSFCLTAPNDEVVLELADGHQIMNFENTVPVALRMAGYRRAMAFNPLEESKQCDGFRTLWNMEGGYKDVRCAGLKHSASANDIARRVIAGFNVELTNRLFSKDYCYKLNIDYVNPTDGLTLIEWVKKDLMAKTDITEKEKKYYEGVVYYLQNYDKWIKKQHRRGLYCDGIEGCVESNTTKTTLSIRGIVKDSEGNPIKNATVFLTVLEPESGEVLKKVFTNREGEWQIAYTYKHFVDGCDTEKFNLVVSSGFDTYYFAGIYSPYKIACTDDEQFFNVKLQ